MIHREGLRLSVRSLTWRPAESLLLIFSVALAVAAAVDMKLPARSMLPNSTILTAEDMHRARSVSPAVALAAPIAEGIRDA